MHKIVRRTPATTQAVHHFWLFVTENCNLKCSYCFFRHRSQGNAFSPDMIPTVFEFFPRAREAKFVISGGEALTDWPKTQQVIDRLKAADGRKYLLLQTNATLLDPSRIEFLARRRVHIEVGLDGRGDANKHRHGLKPYLSRIEKNILLARKAGLNVNATMTVAPDQTASIHENFFYLLGLKIKRIEVTPAAFSGWNNKDAAVFKEKYVRLVECLLRNGLTAVLSTDYDAPLKETGCDIVLLPDGTILSNWALLALPKSLKSRYCACRIAGGRLFANTPPGPKGHYSTYRELSTRYVKLAWRHLGIKGWQSGYDHYADICASMKKTHQKLLS